MTKLTWNRHGTDDRGLPYLMTTATTGRGYGWQNVLALFTVREVLNMIVADDKAREVLYEVVDIQRGLDAMATAIQRVAEQKAAS